jgi:protein-S-isoprenylcysteine O-methyltransferase Ste14
MAGVLAILYGIACYALFLVTFVYSAAFVGNLQLEVASLAPWVPRSIDAGGPAASPLVAFVVDGLLMGVFAVQHSVMARPGFKAAWTRFVPKTIERSTYVLLSSLALILLFWQWRPMTRVVWSTEPGSLGHMLLNGLFWFGWLFVLVSTFMIDHLHLFGVRQAASFMAGRQPPTMRFMTPGFYRFVRHPIMLGFIVAFWAAPVMTVGHLYFAIGTTLYIIVALRFEERDLIDELGDAYVEYREEVRMIVPLPRRRG